MRIVIIGGAGFIGRTLSARLAREGHAVRVADAPDRLAGFPDAHSFEAVAVAFTEIRPDDRLFAGADAVILLSSTSSPASSMLDVEKDAGDNVVSSVRVLEACRRQGVERFLFASSGGAIYGEPSDERVPETHPTRPINAYGAAKLAIEKYMAVFAFQYGLRTVSLRIANAYGPGQLAGARVGAIANFLRRARDGEPLEVWGDGSAVRDYVFVDDIADAFAQSLASPDLASGEYDVGSGLGHSVNRIIAEIAEITGLRLAVSRRPARRVDVSRLVLDPTKLREAVGWRPEVELRDGIARVWRAAQAGGRQS